MDAHVKEGQLYVQHQKFGKKWKKNWFMLYPASQNGIARLEFFDCSNASDKPNTKKLDKKIIRLAECITIVPALTEACPKENMAAFYVETNDKTYIFAAEKQTSSEWVEKMCEIAFKNGSGSVDSNGQEAIKMAENLIYDSREAVNEFWVSVQRTEASERSGLLGTYWLKADSESLILKEPKSKKTLLVWPYKLLRRYGRDKVMFSFEAGRRCQSGPGNFTFETKQGNEIFGIVENAIREQKAQAEEKRQSCPSLDSDCPTLQLPRGDGSREGDADSGGSKPGSADGVFTKRGEEDAKIIKGRSLPEPPPPGGTGTPPRSPLPRGPRNSPMAEDQISLYSEPADSVRLPPSPAEYLYSDPVDSIKVPVPTPAPRFRPQGDQGGKLEPLYSGIYDQVSVELAHRAAAVGLDKKALPKEHIYDEPEGRGTSQVTTLYDEPSAYPSTPSKEDFSVPAFGKQLQSRTKGPKPLPAPKPNKALVPRKDALPTLKVNANLNNNNSGPTSPIYSQIFRHTQPNSPDIIYDNLGEI